MISVRTVPVLIALALAISGCNTTASRELVLAVKNYETRSLEAIASVETIQAKAVEQPPVSASQAEQDFAEAMLTRDIFEPDDDPQTEDLSDRQVVEAGVHMFDLPADLPRGRALDEMRCAHGRFTSVFDDVEAAGILGKSSVANAAPPILVQLIAQQLVLAKLVGGPLHADMLGQKGALIAEIHRIRASEQSDEQKRAAVIAVYTKWRAVEAEEQQLTETAVEHLVKAAATGIALREQIEQYGKWSFSDLVDSANGLSSFMAAVSGEDLSELNGTIEQIRSEIEGDPDLKASVEALLGSINPPLPDSRSRARGAEQRDAVADAIAGAGALPGVQEVSFDMPCLRRDANSISANTGG